MRKPHEGSVPDCEKRSPRVSVVVSWGIVLASICLFVIYLVQHSRALGLLLRG
jgi:hypothetical protein